MYCRNDWDQDWTIEPWNEPGSMIELTYCSYANSKIQYLLKGGTLHYHCLDDPEAN